LKTAVVVGGGFVGAACAWQLQQAGFRCVVIDAADATHAASWGNAGHLAIEQVDPLASVANLRSLPRRLFAFGGPVGLPLRDVGAWLPFGVRLMAAAAPARFARGRRVLSSLLAQAMPAWRRLVAQTGTSQHLRVDGHFVAWESEASARSGKRQWLAADIGDAQAQAASPAELARLRLQFNQRPVDAVRFHNTGQILDLAQARGGITQAVCRAGGSVRIALAEAVVVANGRAAVRLEGGALLDADLVLVAAGAGSAALLRASEGVVPLIAERGYHLDAPAMAACFAPEALPPVAFEDRSVIVTRFASTLRIAGFTEFSRLESPPDPRKWQRLAQHAKELGLPGGPEARPWIGARPTLPDYLPAVGRSRAAPNLMYAFGHQHLGVTLAAVTGELVAAMALGNEPVVDVRPLDLGRFQ
jgi:D-amino-acid dehydrogenase